MNPKLSPIRVIAVLLSALLAVALFALPAPAQTGGRRQASSEGNAGNPQVLPPGSMPYGRSYAEWSVSWWQWAYSLPVTGHPLFDETGADCAAGQSGPVWYLGGVFNVSGSAVRDGCVVPAGKALFFPIINVEWDNFCPPSDPPLTIDELRDTARQFMDLVTELSCEVDGRPIANLHNYRFAGDPFSIQMPGDNIWEFFGCPTAPGSYGPLVPDGFFLMLAPLSAGDHTIHFRGTIGDPVNFTLDITYNLVVMPEGQAGATPAESVESGSGRSADPALSAGPGWTPTSWGRLKSTYR